MISYKVDNHYSPEHERTINWQDNVLDLEWPKFNEYFLSEKDKVAKTLKEFGAGGYCYQPDQSDAKIYWLMLYSTISTEK